MENARRQHRVRFPLQQHRRHVLKRARAAASDHRHPHRFAHATRDHQIKTGLGPVGINAVEHDFPRAQGHGALRPFDRVQPGRFASAVREHLPLFWRDLFRINGNNDALAAEFFGPGADQLRVGQRRRIDADLVRPGPQHGVHVSHRAQSAADGQRHEALVGGALDDLHHRSPALRAGGDVEEHHLVGALFVIAHGQLDGIAHVAQLARLGPAEADAARDLAVMHVQAWNHSLCDHIEG